MTHEETMTKRAISQISLAQDEMLKGNTLNAVKMLENAITQVKGIDGRTNDEKLLDRMLERTKISITIPNDLLNKIKDKAKKLQISVSTCITMLLNKDINL